MILHDLYSNYSVACAKAILLHQASLALSFVSWLVHSYLSSIEYADNQFLFTLSSTGLQKAYIHIYLMQVYHWVCDWHLRSVN